MGPGPLGPGWSCHSVIHAMRQECGFNGAGASRPRMVDVTKADTPSSFWLQWGRGLSAPDGALGFEQKPSVDPLQWGRGLSAPDGVRQPHHGHVGRAGFNGAGASRPRMEARSKWWEADRAALASMGPGPLGPGWQCISVDGTLYLTELQWGRGLSAPDGGHFDERERDRGESASMGPGPLGPGWGPPRNHRCLATIQGPFRLVCSVGA